MQSLKHHGWVPLLASIAAVLLAGCEDPLGDYEWTVENDVVYAVGNVSAGPGEPVWEQRDLLLDVYRPVGAPAPHPVVILVHGGAFTGGSKQNEHMVEYAEYFASYGYAVFAVDYRLESDYPPAPAAWFEVSDVAAAHAAIVDVKAAVRYVRANAGAYNIDAGRIALLGESAGAIAAVAAAVTGPADYAADGPEFPVPEINNPGVSAEVAAYIHLWGNADHVLDQIDPSDPPTMIVHGDEDEEPFAPVESARRLQQQLELVHVANVYYQAAGYGHGAWDYRNDNKGIPRLARDFLETFLNAERRMRNAE